MIAALGQSSLDAGASTPELDAYVVSPGLGGFLAFFALALACWFLYRSFVKHMRRVDVRARLQAQEEAASREKGSDGEEAGPDPELVAPEAPSSDASGRP